MQHAGWCLLCAVAVSDMAHVSFSISLHTQETRRTDINAVFIASCSQAVPAASHVYAYSECACFTDHTTRMRLLACDTSNVKMTGRAVSDVKRGSVIRRAAMMAAVSACGASGVMLSPFLHSHSLAHRFTALFALTCMPVLFSLEIGLPGCHLHVHLVIVISHSDGMWERRR